MNSEQERRIKHFLQKQKLQAKNDELLKTAFIHSSYKNENKNYSQDSPSFSLPTSSPTLIETTSPESRHLERNFFQDNQRLEFIGDAILGCIIKEHLYFRYATANEGHLSRWTSILVNQGTLAQIARRLQMDQLLVLGKGEMQTGGSQKDSNLADVLEALCGALYLDQGYERSRDLILSWFATELENLNTTENIRKDSKSLLQELLQKNGLHLPEYKLEKAEPNKPQFWICVKIGSRLYGQGTGQNRKGAEQMAAANTLTILANKQKSK